MCLSQRGTAADRCWTSLEMWWVSTASHVVHERAQNLNSFIPIQDALKALRIELQSIKTSMRK